VRIVLQAEDDRQTTFELNHKQSTTVPLGTLLVLDKESDTKYRISPMVDVSSRVTPLSTKALHQSNMHVKILKKRPHPTDRDSFVVGDPLGEEQTKRRRRTGLVSSDDVHKFVVEHCDMNEEEATELRRHIEDQKIDGFHCSPSPHHYHLALSHCHLTLFPPTTTAISTSLPRFRF
jgi:hypothetical protein